MARTAFVTGGTGFIGINLIKLLVEKGWDVTAFHRPTSDLTYLKPLDIRLAEGSLVDRDSLEQAVPEHTGVVFHVAGDTNLWSQKNDLQTAVNVEGTRYLVDAAARKGVKIFIYTSSVSAWGDMAGKRINEESPQNGGNSWVNYEYTKWAAEREALEGRKKGMKVIIINPANVTGPHDTNNWGRLFFGLRDGNLPGIPDGSVSVAHVEEVAKAHLSAVDRGRDGERYILAGEENSFENFVKEIARTSGVENVPKKIPTFLLKTIARFSEMISLVTRKPPKITPELVKLMTRKDVSLSSEKAVRELGYRVVPMESAVRDCYDWLVREGYL